MAKAPAWASVTSPRGEARGEPTGGLVRQALAVADGRDDGARVHQVVPCVRR